MESRSASPIPTSVEGDTPAHGILCFELGYCSNIPATAGSVDTEFSSYEDDGPCTDITAPGVQPVAEFTETGLARGTPGSTQDCWTASFDLINTTLSFLDANGGCSFLDSMGNGYTDPSVFGPAENPYGSFWLQLFGAEPGDSFPWSPVCTSAPSTAGGAAVLTVTGTDPNSVHRLLIVGSHSPSSAQSGAVHELGGAAPRSASPVPPASAWPGWIRSVRRIS